MLYAKTYQVRWADLDANMHMKSVAYLEYATHTRFAFLADAGLDLAYFRKNAISPILFEEKINFFRELGPQEMFSVANALLEMDDTCRKWQFKHEVKNAAGVLCAVVTAKGAWFSLTDRKVAAPPREVHDAFAALPRDDRP